MFPLLPLISSVSSIPSLDSFITLSNQLLVNDTLSRADIFAILKGYPEFGKVSMFYNENSYSNDDLIFLLNNGISTIFVREQDSSTVQSLIELGIPECRLAVQKDGVYAYKYQIITYFAKEQIVPIEEISPETYFQSLIVNLQTDRPDGLYTTIVVDDNERCLGLVYSSKDSIKLAIEKKAGVYFSRSRNEIWEKGLTSGNTQKLLGISIDCDGDALKFTVKQECGKTDAANFCHLQKQSCFGNFNHGLIELEQLIRERVRSAPQGSYTKRLIDDSNLLDAKIREEADEVTTAKNKKELIWELSDIIYFLFTKMVANDISLAEVESNLNSKHMKITRREGHAKEQYIQSKPITENCKVHLNVVSGDDPDQVHSAFTRPISTANDIMALVKPIIQNVIENGDKALLDLTKKFDGVQLESPVLTAPFPKEYTDALSKEVRDALDLSIENVRKFHAAQVNPTTLEIETQPGVVCSRFPRPIEKVGLYVPGGTAVLPSTALMLGVPAMVAGCKEIIIASPPRRSDGKISPEVVYVASKIGASKILMAGGAQAIAAMAYGTCSVPKVDKILGPGNQFVTAAKMYIQNDIKALCSIDMPAGPSEVLVICDNHSDPDFVASDLLSQAEHGIDSQVLLIGVGLNEEKLSEIQQAVHNQAMKLPRLEIIRKSIGNSSLVLTDTIEQALALSNEYAPEHLILQTQDAEKYLSWVTNAGSVFVGPYTPESCGDYSSGTNHTLPTYGYARQYSGVNTSTFQKFITSQRVSPTGLQNIGHAVMTLAQVEGLDAHRNAIKIRMEKLGLLPDGFQ